MQDKDRLLQFAGPLLIKYKLGQDRRCEHFRAALWCKGKHPSQTLQIKLKNNAAAKLQLLFKQHAGGLSKQNRS